jgi:hypothetical protein
MPGPGNDPFSGSSVQNLLQHTISPKVVIDEEGTGYVVKSDLINIDNIYISGEIVEGGTSGSGSKYTEYIGNTSLVYRSTVPSPLSGASGSQRLTSLSATSLAPSRTYLVSANVSYQTNLARNGDIINFSLGLNDGVTTNQTNVSTQSIYPYLDIQPIPAGLYTNTVTLTGIFTTTTGTNIPVINFDWNCTTDISGREFLINIVNFGCIRLN